MSNLTHGLYFYILKNVYMVEILSVFFKKAIDLK